MFIILIIIRQLTQLKRKAIVIVKSNYFIYLFSKHNKNNYYNFKRNEYIYKTKN